MKLKEVLLTNNVQELKVICRELEIKRYSKLKKAELVSTLCDFLLDEENLKDLILPFEKDFLDYTYSFLNNKKTSGTDEPDIYTIFPFYCYVYSDGLETFVAKEFNSLFTKLYNNDDFKKENDTIRLLAEYCYAAINLYGIIDYIELLEIYNKQNKENLTEEKYFDYLFLLYRYEQSFEFYMGHLIDPVIALVDDNEMFDYIHSNQKGKPRYLPSKNEFLKFADASYFQTTPQYNQFFNYINKNYIKGKEECEEICNEIQFICSHENMEIVFEVFERNNIYPKGDAQAKHILGLVTDMQNNSRTWLNKGFTPKELSRLYNKDNKHPIRIVNKSIPFQVEQPQIQAIPLPKPQFQVKIGGNAPCPCGSGKKYKKCCALKDNL